MSKGECPKNLEALVGSAFEAGMRAAVGFPTMSAIPTPHIDNSFQRFKDDWTGRPETPDRCSSCGTAEPDHVAYVREKGMCVT